MHIRFSDNFKMSMGVIVCLCDPETAPQWSHCLHLKQLRMTPSFSDHQYKQIADRKVDRWMDGLAQLSSDENIKNWFLSLQSTAGSPLSEKAEMSEVNIPTQLLFLMLCHLMHIQPWHSLCNNVTERTAFHLLTLDSSIWRGYNKQWGSSTGNLHLTEYKMLQSQSKWSYTPKQSDVSHAEEWDERSQIIYISNTNVRREIKPWCSVTWSLFQR